jgi:5-formyltetrahydrofolate cyclo-ligase
VADVATDKRALRERLRARRAGLSARVLAESAGALRDVLLAEAGIGEARTVAAYVSVGGEPGTGPLLDVLEERGVETLLPVQLPDNDLDWARYTGPVGLAPAGRGMLEPQARRLGPDAVRRASVVLVPALAVDRRGYRIGRGAGCYDRVLDRLVGTGIDTIALLHDGEVLDLPVPREPHDRRVAAAATPSGLVRLR